MQSCIASILFVILNFFGREFQFGHLSVLVSTDVFLPEQEGVFSLMTQLFL